MQKRYRLGLGWSILAIVVLKPSISSVCVSQREVANDLKQEKVVSKNTTLGVAYTGSNVCAGCHKDIYDSYIQTAMGRSMSLPGESSHLERVPSPVTVFDQELNRYFQVFRQGSDIYQSEYALDSDDKELYRQTEKIEFVVGAGSNGISYIVRRGDYLFEAPLTFYTTPKIWGLSPGYESHNFGFSRPILGECIVCHSGFPQPVPQRYGLYKNPPFRELSVGCENCHGPGELHVTERAKGVPISGSIDPSIVNPAKLPGWLGDNICMNCHQSGDVRVLQPGKDYLDYRPGTPLDNTVAIFKVPLKRDLPSQSDLLEHNFSMNLSKCYRTSGSQLRCLSCHNPHYQVTEEQRPEYYRKRCLSCHAEGNCRLLLQDRVSRKPPDDCAGCHMPKRNVKGIEHAALTNHRIVIHRDEPYPEDAFRSTIPTVPGLIHLSAIPGRSNVSIPTITLLQAYRKLLMMGRQEYQENYLTLLNQLAKTQPKNTVVLAALAQKELASQLPQANSRAVGYLKRAIQLGSASPNDYRLLGDLLARSGQLPEAVDVLKRGISLAPYVNELYQSLAVHYISMGKYSDAVETIKKGLELFPGDKALRILLNKTEPVLLPPNALGVTIDSR